MRIRNEVEATDVDWYVPRLQPSAAVCSRNELELSAGGLQRHADGSSEHFEWIVHTLAVGDETRVRVVEVEALAEPISVTREESSKREQSERVL